MGLLVRLLLKSADDIVILLDGFKDCLDKDDKTKLIALHRSTVMVAEELRKKYVDVPTRTVRTGERAL